VNERTWNGFFVVLYVTSALLSLRAAQGRPEPAAV
jgi:hypothetical protein